MANSYHLYLTGYLCAGSLRISFQSTAEVCYGTQYRIIHSCLSATSALGCEFGGCIQAPVEPVGKSVVRVESVQVGMKEGCRGMCECSLKELLDQSDARYIT